MRPNAKGEKNNPVITHELTGYPTLRTIKTSEKPSRRGELLNSPQDNSRWQVLPNGKFPYRRKYICYPSLDGLFQGVCNRCHTVLVYVQNLHSGKLV